MLDGRIMGLDVGDKTIGVAVSDLMGLTAQGVKTIKRVGKKKDIEELKAIIKEKQVNKIVSGEFWDERLSTVAAERSLLEADVSRQKRKKVIDMLAAVIILQGYLDFKINS